MKTQYGFRKGRSTVDAVFIARRIQEHAERTGRTGLMLLLDWEKAFDKVSQEWLMIALRSLGIPEDLMKVIEGLYRDPLFYVEIDGIKSSTARQNTGIRQGCPFSPYSFILLMDRMFDIIPHIAEEHQSGMAKQRRQKQQKKELLLTFQALLYADDTLVCEENENKCEVVKIDKKPNL